MTPAAELRRADHERLEKLTASLFARHGLAEADANIIARCLIRADLRGVGTHGISRLPIYLERLKRGLINAASELELSEPSAVCALLDGDNGFGFIAATRAMDQAIARADQFGIGMVGVKRSNHFGMAACYLLQAIDAGYVALVLTNASATMPVWGGREPFLGTSPFAFGAPGNPPIVLDMATSVVARGKIRVAAAKGEPIPQGWALDADGNPTTDAQAGYDGTILPLGGPKGSGLSLMMEIIAGVMTGAAFGGQVRNQYDSFEGEPDVGHTMIALKPGVFVGNDYALRIAELVARAKASTPVDPAQPILMPGEPEAMREADRRLNGIPLSISDIDMLVTQAKANGLSEAKVLETLI
ncbi:Ldh family oxidoreductase [Devosia sp. 2618]|uniref:Ldh family oxidoreductase n=1 Tax=Devosia sp. 2618 TaxID=3156454 RepID=UPI003394213D